VVEVSFTAWSGVGRVRHPVYLGLRVDKAAQDVIMEVPDPQAEQETVHPASRDTSIVATLKAWKGAVRRFGRPPALAGLPRLARR
jgi:bifunctional non-homologous end joining protein LigD